MWEERFAVTLAGSRPRSVAYLTLTAAEAWCLEQLTLPVGALGRLATSPSGRLGYRVLEADAPSADNGGEFTLRGLVDALSRLVAGTSR